MFHRYAVPALGLVLLTACSSDAKPESAPTPVPSTPPAATSSPTGSPSALPSATASPTTAPSPSPSIEQSAPAPGAPTCKAAALTLTDADTLVSQQSREQVYVIRTTGPDCGLQGYPTVTLKGADGKDLAVRYTRTGPAPAPLSLSRGTSVSFSVTSTRTGTCADAARIAAVIPGTGGTLTASTTARICEGSATVSAVRRLNADN